MASGWSTNVVSVSARPFQYRPIGFLFLSVSLSSPNSLFFILMSSLYCAAEIRRTVRCGEGRVETYLDLAVNGHGKIAGDPSALFRAPLMIPVFLCHWCLALHHKKNRVWQEQTAAQLVIMSEKMPYWVITKRWSDTSESVQMFHNIKFTIRVTLD